MTTRSHGFLIVDGYGHLASLVFSDEARQNRTLSSGYGGVPEGAAAPAGTGGAQMMRENYRIMPAPTAELSRDNAASDDPVEIFRSIARPYLRWLNEQ